ncbi:hypothetical protein TNCV_852031 [Trichonephila clavipes]|nr:hypothetical protein TNCV_852031 [Trichonephila clavipes]
MSILFSAIVEDISVRPYMGLLGIGHLIDYFLPFYSEATRVAMVAECSWSRKRGISCRVMDSSPGTSEDSLGREVGAG